MVSSESSPQKVIIPFSKEVKGSFEKMGILHILVNKEFIVIEKDYASVFDYCFGLSVSASAAKEKLASIVLEDKSNLAVINELSSIKFRDRSGTFIGARMGRPEKGKMRKLTGSPHVLFPVSSEGGRLRSFQSAVSAGKVTADFPLFYCESCAKETIYPVCETCGARCIKRYLNPNKSVSDTEVPGQTRQYSSRPIDIVHYYNSALQLSQLKMSPDLVKGVRGTSNEHHVPEHLVKGILRAKHDLYVNKDGTIRYDMSQLPITHFKPREIGTTLEKLKELGYSKDIYHAPLESPDQILELKPQDIVLPRCEGAAEEGADNILKRTADFVDDLLEFVYSQDRFYNLNSPDDLVGHLVMCLAPHTSGAIIGRIIGFSKSQVLFAHPLLHAATRRDCDGDEACVMLILDAFLNFSRGYLPAHRGATQDAPLVATSYLYPTEVDDMVFHLDIGSRYPLALYNAALEYKMPWEVKLPQIEQFLNTPKQYEGMMFTHDTSSINAGILCSAYKTLPSMKEKMDGQMDLADRIVAVDADDVARLVIEKHFMKDTKGNLRKFSTQIFRCVDCNEKFRRPPLAGKCTSCGGKILFTVAEGSVIKYLQPALDLAKKYNLAPYLQQNLLITKQMIEDVFGKEKEVQSGLKSWFS